MNHQNPLPSDNVSHRDTNNKCNDKDYLASQQTLKTINSNTEQYTEIQINTK